MATSNSRSLHDSKNFVGYLMDDQNNPKRVQFVSSTFAGNQDLDAIMAEMKIYQGRKGDGHELEISFSPQDRKLTEQEFRAFADEAAQRFFGDRNYIAVCHGDKAHQHIHIVASFLDTNRRPMNFSHGRQYDLAEKRQTIIDDLCQKHGLSVLPREQGQYNTKEGIRGYRGQGGGRETKAEKRMREDGKQPWKSDMRRLVRDSMERAKDYPDFIARLEKSGIKISRETEHSLTFTDSAGHRARAGSLFSKYRTRTDIEEKITSNLERQTKYQKAVNKLSSGIDRRIEALKFEGSQEGVEALQALKDRLSTQGTEGTLSEKWSQYKEVRAEVENVLPYEQMREIETARFSEALATKRACNTAASALLSSGSQGNDGPATGQGGEEGGGSGGHGDTKGKSKEEAAAIKMGNKIRMDGQKALKILLNESKKNVKSAERERQKAEAEAKAAAQELAAIVRMGTTQGIDTGEGTGGGFVPDTNTKGR